MMIVVIHPDTHEARRLGLKAKDTFGPGLVIVTAESPAAAAQMMRDLAGEKRVPWSLTRTSAHHAHRQTGAWRSDSAPSAYWRRAKPSPSRPRSRRAIAMTSRAFQQRLRLQGALKIIESRGGLVLGDPSRGSDGVGLGVAIGVFVAAQSPQRAKAEARRSRTRRAWSSGALRLSRPRVLLARGAAVGLTPGAELVPERAPFHSRVHAAPSSPVASAVNSRRSNGDVRHGFKSCRACVCPMYVRQGLVALLALFLAGCTEETVHLQVELINDSSVALEATIVHNGKEEGKVSVPAGETVLRELDIKEHKGVHDVRVTWREAGSSSSASHSQQVNLDDADCPDPTVITFPVGGTPGAIAALTATDDC